MKFQLKKEVISSLTSETAGKVKGGTATELTSAIPSLYPSCACVHNNDFHPLTVLTEDGKNGK